MPILYGITHYPVTLTGSVLMIVETIIVMLMGRFTVMVIMVVVVSVVLVAVAGGISAIFVEVLFYT